MINVEQFLERVGLDNQPLHKKYPAGSDWDLKKVLERFWKLNEPEKLLHDFWQRASDACPLEASIAEQEEKQFEKWVTQKQ
jgi:hypothetical protein